MNACEASLPQRPEPCERDLRASMGLRETISRYRQTLLTVGIITLLIGSGYVVRVWVFRYTAPIRFVYDLDSAWSNGTRALDRGEGDFFGGIITAYEPWHSRSGSVNYPPLRMYIKTAWVWYIKHRWGPDVHRSDAVMYPMLAVNFTFELLGALGMYRLCRLFRGRGLSCAAACCLWFNPALIFNTFGWTQWDAWVIAPAVWATWAVLRPGRFSEVLKADLFAGACLGVGTMLKGQILFVAVWFFLVVIGLSFLDPASFGTTVCVCPSRRLRLQQAAARSTMLMAGFVVAVSIIVLPLALHGSARWLSIYRREVSGVLPMSVGAWNLPAFLACRYGWASDSIQKISLLGFTLALSTMQWLKYLFFVWFVLITLLSLRARKHPEVLLTIGAIFAATFAVLPGMHERYALWAAAFLAVSVCVRPAAVFLYAMITGLALACPLSVCIRRNITFAPGLQSFFDSSAATLSLLWLMGAMALTMLLAHVPPSEGFRPSDSQTPVLEPHSRE
jgi:hypothetical protein